MKKFLPYLLITIISIGFLTPTLQIQAQTNYADCILKNGEGASECDTFPGSPKSVEAEKKAVRPVEDVNNNYVLLQPLTCQEGDSGCVNGQLTTFDPSGQGKLGIYLNFAIKLFIALCAVAAVVMIVIGGIEWAGSELISKKEDGKQRIWQAVLGLVLALSSYLILYTINPDLLNTDVDVGGASVESEEQQFVNDLEEAVITVGGPITSSNSASIGTNCDANAVMGAAEAAGMTITNEQAATMACIGGKESGGCKSVKNFNWNSGSSAFGAWQVLLKTHSKHFENPACWAAAGVAPNTPLGCSSRSELCIKAASNFNCNASAALRLMRIQPNFMDWLVTQNPCPNARCVAKFSPKMTLPPTPEVNRAGQTTGRYLNLYTRCRI